MAGSLPQTRLLAVKNDIIVRGIEVHNTGGNRRMSYSEMSPASKTSDVHRLVMRLNHQYITRNDGRGRNGLCRVSSGDLLDLLRYVEKMAAHPPSRHRMCDACKPSFEDA